MEKNVITYTNSQLMSAFVHYYDKRDTLVKRKTKTKKKHIEKKKKKRMIVMLN